MILWATTYKICRESNDGNKRENNFGDKIVFGTGSPRSLAAASDRFDYFLSSIRRLAAGVVS